VVEDLANDGAGDGGTELCLGCLTRRAPGNWRRYRLLATGLAGILGGGEALPNPAHRNPVVGVAGRLVNPRLASGGPAEALATLAELLAGAEEVFAAGVMDAVPIVDARRRLAAGPFDGAVAWGAEVPADPIGESIFVPSRIIPAR